MSHQNTTRLLPLIAGSVLLSLLTACGSSNGSGDIPPAQGNLPATPTLSIASSIKQMHFSWKAVSDATYYKIYQNLDGASGFTQMGENITAMSHDHELAVHRQNWSAARYLLEACNAASCTASHEVNTLGAVLQAIGYFKASNTNTYDNFATAIALSSDGSTLAVGAPGESSGATGVNGDQGNSPSADRSGAVYIFTRRDNVWSQQAYIKASNTSAGDFFGRSIALSSDGHTLAVGAYLEDSPGTGINGNQGGIADNNSNAGAAYVFTRSGSAWSQQAYVKASNTKANAYFGHAVSLNGDGNTLAVGAIGENTGGLGAGAVYVFTRNAGAWSQQTFVTASNAGANDAFGTSLALSSDGHTLAIGATGESSSATGINGDQSRTAPTYSGAVYVFTSSANSWSQQAYVKASNTGPYNYFGSAVALSGDGNRLAVAANAEESVATGIDGNQADNSAGGAGAVYVFTRDVSAWSQQAYVKASNTAATHAFGSSLGFSSDGNTLAVGALGEASAAAGTSGNQTDNSSGYAGAVYVFTHSGSSWSQQNYVKATNTSADDYFGASIALSGDGNTLAVGAFGEDSVATGMGGDQADNSAANAGAVYLY